jgi:Zn-dependent protease
METVISDTLGALMPHTQVRDGIVLFVGLVISISLHEFGHAAMAVWLGDPTPRSPTRLLRGRVTDLGAVLGVTRGTDNRYTVNPAAHADPVGTVVLPLFALFLMPTAALFGWGRPVPFNPAAARAKVSRKRMVILVSLAGPMMNLLQALAYSVLLVGLLALGVYGTGHDLADAATGWIATLVALNLLLAFFNMLPVPPLDGGQILVHSLERTNPQWSRWLQQYGLFVFLILFPMLPFILSPVQSASRAWITWLMSLAGEPLFLLG